MRKNKFEYTRTIKQHDKNKRNLENGILEKNIYFLLFKIRIITHEAETNQR